MLLQSRRRLRFGSWFNNNGGPDTLLCVGIDHITRRREQIELRGTKVVFDRLRTHCVSQIQMRCSTGEEGNLAIAPGLQLRGAGYIPRRNSPPRALSLLIRMMPAFASPAWTNQIRPIRVESSDDTSRGDSSNVFSSA
jgi:hypothetical protein